MRQDITDLEVIQVILKYKSEIKYNPFENYPQESLEEALELLEEYEDIK